MFTNIRNFLNQILKALSRFFQPVTAFLARITAPIRERISRRTAIIILVVVAVIVVIVGFISYRARQAYQQQLEGLQTVEVEIGTLTATVGATGTVRANQSANLPWKTSGTVDEVLAQVGDQVDEGDILAELVIESMPQSVIRAASDLVAAQNAQQDLLDAYNELAVANAAQAAAQAEQAVEDAQTYLDNVSNPASQKYVDQAEATLILAREKLEDAQEDYDKGQTGNTVTRATLQNLLSIAQQEYDNAVSRYNTLVGGGDPLDIENAQAELAVALASLDEARQDYKDVLAGPDPGDLAAAEANIAAAEATLELGMIKVPISGTVTRADPKPGDQVSTGEPAFRVDDLSSLLVDVEISEVDINRIEPGQRVTMTFDAVLSRDYEGVVKEVDLAGEEVQGVVNFGVIIELVDVDEMIKPGMTSGVSIVVSELENVLAVPNRAVRVIDGQRTIYVLGDAGLEKIEIELGSSSDLYSEVVDGDLEPGDMIVLNPPAQPFEGPPGGRPGGD